MIGITIVTVAMKYVWMIRKTEFMGRSVLRKRKSAERTGFGRVLRHIWSGGDEWKIIQNSLFILQKMD